jgi:molecular chaperone GrpE
MFGKKQKEQPVKEEELLTEAPAGEAVDAAAAPPEQAVPAGEAQGSGAEDAAPPPEPTPEERIARLQDEKLRLQAEMQNVVKRAQREKQEALKYAEADFAKELLLILDDLERTRESAKTAENIQAVADGVRIVYEHFLKVLRARGVEPLEAAGKPFNPDRHEALLQQPSAEHPAGTVMQELQRGYVMHERVLRPARVIVSSGPAGENEKTGAAAAGAGQDGAADKEG